MANNIAILMAEKMKQFHACVAGDLTATEAVMFAQISSAYQGAVVAVLCKIPIEEDKE